MPDREGRGLMVAMAALALAGVAVMATGTLEFSGLGASTAAADAEGPGLVRRLAKIAAKYRATRTDLRVKIAKWKAAPHDRDRQPGRAEFHSLIAALAQSTADAETGIQTLRASAKGRFGGAAVLERSKTGLQVVLHDGALAGWASLKTESVGTGRVDRIEAQSRGGGSRLLFVTPVPGAPTGKTWLAYVWYDDVMLLNPDWQPLRSAMARNLAGLLLLLTGGFGWYFAVRRRRRALAEAVYGAA